MGFMNDDQKITTEDQELADMIAGLNSGTSPKPVPAPVPVPPTPTVPVDDIPIAEPNSADFSKPITPINEPIEPIAPKPADVGGLGSVKLDVLNELKPLVDKLDLPAEEKFDTLLLLIRSTDDRSLIEPAHNAAKAIPDEKRRAAALLDIIKEIDFFENPS